MTHQVDKLARVLFAEHRRLLGRSELAWVSIEEYERAHWRQMAVVALRFAHGVEVEP